jgi:hypothetical protein
MINNTSRWDPLIDWEIISRSYLMFVPLFNIAYMLGEILLAMDWDYYVLVLCETSGCWIRHVMLCFEL